MLNRLSLGVQQFLYPFDDVSAMGQEQVEQFDVFRKGYLARAVSG